MPDRDMERHDELVDRGWQQMSEVLDREMPQSRPRRKLLVWIPIAVIGLLAVSYGTWASGILKGNNVNDNKPVQTEQTDKKEVNDNILSSRFQKESNNPDQVEVEHDSDVAVSESVVEAEAVADDLRTTVLADPVHESENIASTNSNYQKNRILGLSDESNELDLDRRDMDGATNLPGISSADVSSSGDVRKLGITPISTDRFAFPVNYVESRLPSAFSARMKEVGFITPSSVMFEKKFGLDAYVASHWDSPFTLQGIEAGLLVSWDFSRRWSVTSGLAYGHHRKLGIADLSPGKSDDQELALNPSDPDTTSFTGGTVVDLSRVSYDTAETLINKLNYLHIPLHVEFRATRGLSLRAGFRTSYMIGAPVSQMGRVFIAQPQFSNNVLLDANSSPRFLVKEGVVRRWDVAPMFGVGWEITRLLAIDVQYQHGLIPYIDREATERSDFNRTLSVGLRMKIL